MIVRGGLKWPGSFFRIGRPVYLVIVVLCAASAIVYEAWGLLIPLGALPFLSWLRDRHDYRWMDRL